MSQKEALLQALVYAQSSFPDLEMQKAARAFCLLAWLEEKSMESEIYVLLNQINITEGLNTAFHNLEANDRETTKLYHIAYTLDYIFGWKIDAAGWKQTHGETFVHELWGIITFRVD